MKHLTLAVITAIIFTNTSLQAGLGHTIIDCGESLRTAAIFTAAKPQQ